MKKKYIKTILIAFLVAFLSTSPLFASTNPPELPGLFKIIYEAVKIFFSLIAIVTAAMVVKGAYMWMASGGDPQKVKQAQGTLTWAVIGLIFFIMAPFIFDFVLRLLGVELPTPEGTGLF